MVLIFLAKRSTQAYPGPTISHPRAQAARGRRSRDCARYLSASHIADDESA